MDDGYAHERELRHRNDSKARLSESVKKRIKTTMIGAISSIEDKLGFLWEDNPKMFDLYQQLRSEILDKGNDQVRSIDGELSQYEISYNRYQVNIPIKKIRKD